MRLICNMKYAFIYIYTCAHIILYLVKPSLEVAPRSFYSPVGVVYGTSLCSQLALLSVACR